MRKIWIVLRNRKNILINKILYGNEAHKKDKKRVWVSLILLILAGLILFMISLLFSNMLLSMILNYLNKIPVRTQIRWLSLFLFSLTVSTVFNNLKNGIIRFLQADDFANLLLAPLSAQEFILAKLFERHYINLAGWTVFLALPVAINLVLMLNPATVTVLAGTLAISGIFILGNTIRVAAILLVIRAKILHKQIIGYTLFYWFAMGLNVISLIYIFQPFAKIIDNSKFRTLLGASVENHFYKFMVEAVLNQILPHNWLAWAVIEAGQQRYALPFLRLTGFYLLVAIVVVLTRHLMKDIEKEALFGLFYEFNQPKSGIKLERFSARLNSSLSWVNPQTRAILVKDFRSLIRDRKFTWIPVLVMVLLGFAMSTGVFAFVQSKATGIKINRDALATLLVIFGANLTVFALLDRFSIDSEGNNFLVLKASPVRAVRIISAKILCIVLVALPVTVLMNIIVTLFFHSLTGFVLFGAIAAVPTLATMGITATTTFPNFEYTSLLDLPTTKAKILMNFLATVYIFLGGGILFYFKSPYVGLGLFILLSLALTIVFFSACCRKVEENQFENSHSIREIWS